MGWNHQLVTSEWLEDLDLSDLSSGPTSGPPANSVIFTACGSPRLPRHAWRFGMAFYWNLTVFQVYVVVFYDWHPKRELEIHAFPSHMVKPIKIHVLCANGVAM